MYIWHFNIWKNVLILIFYNLDKEGPLYNAAWSPSSNEFCVIYGFMPAKATLYNLKCDPVIEFGTGTFNAVYYNPFGNNILYNILKYNY